MLIRLQDADGPLHRRIYTALKSAIRAGRLGKGARLPSTRKLAADLKVSRNTVALAYEQLAAEGYVMGRHRSAMLVLSGLEKRPQVRAAALRRDIPGALSSFGKRVTGETKLPDASSYVSLPRLRYDFRYGRPTFDEFPHEAWRRLLMSRMRRACPAQFGYGPPAGHEPLRAALADYLARARGLSCEAEQILIVNGSQQAFDLVSRVILDPGDAVVVEEPGYSGSRAAFQAAGAKLVPVAVDEAGLDTSKLPSSAVAARMACVTPCHQFPTGMIMPLSRRLALLDWATQSGAWIVEDDYVSEFRYEGRPIEAMHALDDTGRVIYVGTFSKVLYPALRLAYLVLPPALVGPVTAAKWVSDRYSAVLGQEALADFITSGAFERYLRRACARNALRRQALIGALERHLGDRIEIAGSNAGVHLLVWLNEHEPSGVTRVIERAASAGVGIYPINSCYSRQPRRAGLLLGYASMSTTQIRTGVRRFAEIL